VENENNKGILFMEMVVGDEKMYTYLAEAGSDQICVITIIIIYIGTCSTGVILL